MEVRFGFNLGLRGVGVGFNLVLELEEGFGKISGLKVCDA